MKILKNSVQFWKICGVYLPTTPSTLDIRLSIVSILVVLSGLQTFYWLSLAYVITERGTIDTVNLFYPMLQICAVAAVIGPYVFAIFARGNFGEMVEQLQQIIDKSK